MDGFLLIDKPKGWTSHDVCHRLKKILHTKKIGHTGTLDPMAEGVLMVMVGSAARLSEYLVIDDKEYVATIRFGIRTDTQDTTGEVLAQKETSVTSDELQRVLPRFIGKQKQIPPMYSAIKYKGKHLYDYARKGETLDIPARDIEIYDISLISEQLPSEAELRVSCSKGTYIRTLCNDIGETLGCHAAMSALRRTKIGRYTCEQAHTIEDVERLSESGAIESILIPLDEPLYLFPRVDVKEDNERFAIAGNMLGQHNFLTDISQIQPATKVRIYANNCFLAVGTCQDGQTVKPNKVLVRAENE